jgi:hypothetical protein
MGKVQSLPSNGSSQASNLAQKGMLRKDGGVMTRVVIFDLGGVLLPFNRQRRVGAMVTALGLTSADVVRFLTSGVTEELDRGECDLEASAARMSAYAKRPVTAAEAKQLWLSVFEEPNIELWNAVAQLRGYARTYALSDNPVFVFRSVSA